MFLNDSLNNNVNQTRYTALVYISAFVSSVAIWITTNTLRKNHYCSLHKVLILRYS